MYLNYLHPSCKHLTRNWIERLPPEQKVRGSNPLGCSRCKLLFGIALRNRKAMVELLEYALELVGFPNQRDPDEFFDVKVPEYLRIRPRITSGF